jgi:DNA-binding CsgD family transcriptional regulator
MIRAVEELDRFDVSDVAGDISAPTLVMQARQAAWPPIDVTRKLSAAIPNARLAIVEGDQVHPFGNDPNVVHGVIDSFLGTQSTAVPAPTTASASPERPPAGLTEREVQTLRLVADGMSNKEIAAELAVTVNTVERHLVNIYGKIGARGRADATAYALKNNLA